MASNQQFPYSRAGKLHFYCPLCQHHQTTNTIEKVRWWHHAQLLLLTLAISVLLSPWLGWAGLVLYPVFWAGFEFFYRLRKRQALVCESCGFDPFLYKRDSRVARQALRQHWEGRISRENLFAGKKLKNYKTAPPPEQPSPAASAAPNSTEPSQRNPSAPSAAADNP